MNDRCVLKCVMFVCFLPSRVEDLGGKQGMGPCSRGHSTCRCLGGFHCDVLQHPGRRPTDGESGALQSLSPRSARLALPLQPVAGRNPEMGTGCETESLFFSLVNCGQLRTSNTFASFLQILCLQEVQESHYRSCFYPALSQRGGPSE